MKTRTLALAVEGSYERLFLPRRTNSKGARLQGSRLYFQQRMELSGAFSNPRPQLELPRLGEIFEELQGTATVSPRQPRTVPPAQPPVLATVTTVLELAGQPMRTGDIHEAAERLSGQTLRLASEKRPSLRPQQALPPAFNGSALASTRRSCSRLLPIPVVLNAT